MTNQPQPSKHTITGVNARIDKMGTWANGINERLTALDKAFVGLLAVNGEQDNLLAELKMVEDTLATVPLRLRDANAAAAELRHKIAEAQDQTDAEEAQLYINVCAELDDNNKPMFTNEAARKAALALAKQHQPGYKSAAAILRALEAEQARTNAEIGYLEGEIKTARSRYIGIVARLENATARLSITNHK